MNVFFFVLFLQSERLESSRMLGSAVWRVSNSAHPKDIGFACSSIMKKTRNIPLLLKRH